MSLAKSESPTCRVTFLGYLRRNNMNKNTQVSTGLPCDELRLSATELAHEEHIKRLGEQMMVKYSAWARTGCFAARGELDAAHLKFKTAIGERSLAVVVRMDAERGLS